MTPVLSSVIVCSLDTAWLPAGVGRCREARAIGRSASDRDRVGRLDFGRRRETGVRQHGGVHTAVEEVALFLGGQVHQGRLRCRPLPLADVRRIGRVGDRRQNRHDRHRDHQLDQGKPAHSPTPRGFGLDALGAIGSCSRD